MSTAESVMSVEDAKHYIDAIDFSMVVDKVVRVKGWRQKDVLKICQYYRHFLYLHKKYGPEHGELPPSEEVDEFWHNHVLDTHKYHQDCQTIFGSYLHHYPYFGIDDRSNAIDLNNAFERMQQLYEKEFGDKVYRIRPLGIWEAIKIAFEIVKETVHKRRRRAPSAPI